MLHWELETVCILSPLVLFQTFVTVVLSDASGSIRVCYKDWMISMHHF